MSYADRHTFIKRVIGRQPEPPRFHRRTREECDFDALLALAPPKTALPGLEDTPQRYLNAAAQELKDVVLATIAYLELPTEERCPEYDLALETACRAGIDRAEGRF